MSENDTVQSNPHGNHICLAIRAQILALKQFGATNIQIADITAVSVRQIRRFWAKALERGYNPTTGSKALNDEYLPDDRRSGRPIEATPEAKEALLNQVRQTRKSRSYTLIELSKNSTYGLAPSTIYRILKEARFSSVKPTRKPGLTEAMKAARLKFCLDHQDWTLDDWKKIIWSDETSVQFGHRRGGERVWRTPEEAYNATCIRLR